MAERTGRVLKLANTIHQSLPAASRLGHHFHYHLLSSLCAMPPDLESILKFDKVWDFMFTAHGTSAEKWTLETQLTRLLAAVRGTLVESAACVCEGTVVLHDLHTILRSKGFYNLVCCLLRYTAFTPAVLTEQRRVLESFDTQLAEVNVYVNFFCNCGVPIDASELHATVGTLTKQYEELQAHACTCTHPH